MSKLRQFVKVALLSQYINTLKFDIQEGQVGYSPLEDLFKKQCLSLDQSIEKMKSLVKYYDFYLNILLQDKKIEDLYKEFITHDEIWDIALDLDGDLSDIANFVDFHDNEKLFLHCESKLLNYYKNKARK